MRGRHCLAFLADAIAIPDLRGGSSVVENDVIALFDDRAPRLRLSRKTVLRAASDRMARLEALMESGTVLPTLSDVCLTTEQARTAIRANREVLEQARNHLRGSVQFQLFIRWDDDAALRHFRAEPGALGRSDDADDLRRRFRHRVDTLLEDAGADILALPSEDTTVVNLALLVERQNQVGLEAAVEDIDRMWPEGLAIRLVGPSPGVSFASLSLRWIGVAEVEAALGLLTLKAGATHEEIRAKRRAALIEDKSANGAAIAAAADLLARAAAAGWPAGPIPSLSLWSEDRAAPDVMRGAA